MTQEAIKAQAKKAVLDILERDRKSMVKEYENLNARYSAIESSDFSETAKGQMELESVSNLVDIAWEAEKILEAFITFISMT